MIITHLTSATAIVESGGTRVLMDPWLVDGEYFGSWRHYPPFAFDPRQFDDIDFIYLSHIHPDHVSQRTLAALDRRIPVLMHRYESPFLQRLVEGLGFRAVTLEHNRRTKLAGDLHINILAADDCNPELCGRFFGCAPLETHFGSTQIDSLCVLDDGRHVAVNVNDCPFALARPAVEKIRRQYERVDFLLVGYAGAGPYPQCFKSLSDEEKRSAAERKQRQFLRQAEEYVSLLAPRWYMPFAGTYVLAGRLEKLNAWRGIPELHEALDFLAQSPRIDPTRCRGVLLNRWARFDLARGEASAPYVPVDVEARRRYVEETLSGESFAYESLEVPALADLCDLLSPAYERFDRKRREIGFSSATRIHLPLVDGVTARLSADGKGFELVAGTPVDEPWLSLETDPRLLAWLLQGPKHAHWNNAEVGSHIVYDRRPDVYERGLHYCLCSLHA